jgi:WD40 repeat protein
LSEDTAEVAHEALIREWPQLREWLSQDREGIILHRRLTESAHEWELLDRDADAVYRGARLAQANEWSTFNPNALNAQERMFLDASNMQAKREEQEREEQRQRELAAAKELAETQHQSASRLRIRNRVITTVGTIAIILALLAGMLGFRSNKNAITADANARTAFARELAAASLANLNADPERSILLALHGVNVTAPDELVLPEVENALHRAIASSRIRKTFAAHQGEIWTMAYSSDGTLLGTSSVDKNLRIWDTTTYKNLLTLNMHDAEVKSIAFSPDGKWIAAASSDGSARIWDVKTGQLEYELKGHTKAVQAITFSPDGKQLATSSMDKSIKFWDTSTWKELATWRSIQEPTNQLVYSSDGTRILFVDDRVLTNEEGHLHIMNVTSGEEIYQVPLGYYGFTLSPDGKQLALTLTGNKFISILDASNGQPLYNIPRPPNRIMWMAFSPDSSRLAVAGLDRKVHIWDTGTGIELFTLSGHTEFVSMVAFSPDGKHLASGAFDGTIKIWSLESPSEVFPIALSGYANRLAVSPDGALIAATGSSPTTNRQDSLTMWDAHNGNLIYERKAHPEFPVAIAFSPDGKEVATGGVDYTVKVWDAATGAVRLNLPVEDGVIWSIAYHPDGQRFAVVGSEGMIRFYDRATGKALRSWDGGIGWLASVAFSPDGSRLAIVGGESSDAKVWDTAAGKELLTLTGHMNANWSVAFSPDGARIVTCGNDGTARIWDAATGKLLLTLAGHTSTIVTARFSPDGSRVTTASKDGTNRVWDSATGKELVSVEGVFSPNDGQFTPDGKRLVIGGLGIQVIALTTDELVQIAQSRLTRSLTTEECQKYLHMEECPNEP